MNVPSPGNDPFENRVIEIYHSTVAGLYSAAASWTHGDRGLAEDLVQETYLRAIRHWRRHGLPEHPGAWLRTVARNLLVSHARRHRRETLDPDPEDADTRASMATGRLALAEGLDSLGDKNASLLRSFHLEGRTVREIAHAKNLSERAVEGRLRRARQALRRWLGAEKQERRG